MKYFDYYVAKSAQEASELKKKLKDARFYAGGTDVLVRLKQRTDTPAALIDIKQLNGIKGITEKAKTIEIGAATTMNEIAESEIITKYADVLAQGAWEVGSYQIRNLATIGGNICNAAPSADTAPPLLVLNAQLELISAAGKRTVDITDFFKGPGKTILAKDEFVYKIIVPKYESGKGKYIKLSRVAAVDLAIVGVAVFMVPSSKNKSGYDIRVALGAVAPTPIRVPKAEAILAESVDAAAVEAAAQEAQKAAKPISDVRASAEYRSDQVYVLTKRALNIILGREVEK